MRTEFDWDPQKAAANLAKHQVSFDEAMTIFADPLALSKLDPDSSQQEERWVTIGMSRATRLLLVVHTHIEIADDLIHIRLISARRPTRNEARQYQDNPQGNP